LTTWLPPLTLLLSTNIWMTHVHKPMSACSPRLVQSTPCRGLGRQVRISHGAIFGSKRLLKPSQWTLL
jgi:hypothetical protein